MVSGSYKVRQTRREDSRNNWLEFMFVAKCRFNVFRKQSVIDTCTAAFRELENLGFEFGEIGFGGTHVHFHVNVPKRYSAQNAEIMLKSRAAMRIFKAHPGFRKRYPRGSFWSGYEHHMSVGLERKSREDYVKNQEKHHNMKVVDDRQKNLLGFTLFQERTGIQRVR